MKSINYRLFETLYTSFARISLDPISESSLQTVSKPESPATRKDNVLERRLDTGGLLSNFARSIEHGHVGL